MIVSLHEAVNLIRAGRIVAIPTETVYGLAADAKNLSAIHKTFETKGRPPDNPFIVHISDIEQADGLAREIPEEFYSLAKTFWPGPLTLILHKKATVPDVVTGGLDTVAIRMPNHPLALKLIRQTGPLTAPSANPSGKPSPTRAVHVLYDYENAVPVLDGGPTRIGLESTVLNLTSPEPEILRPGAVTASMIEKVIDKKVHIVSVSDTASRAKSPGTRYTHYKPNAEIVLLDSVPSQFDPEGYYILHSASAEINAINVHSYPGDFSGLATDLYDHFRTADHLGYPKIYIESIPDADKHPLIQALNNRIRKAAGLD